MFYGLAQKSKSVQRCTYMTSSEQWTYIFGDFRQVYPLIPPWAQRREYFHRRGDEGWVTASYTIIGLAAISRNLAPNFPEYSFTCGRRNRRAMTQRPSLYWSFPQGKKSEKVTRKGRIPAKKYHTDRRIVTFRQYKTGNSEHSWNSLTWHRVCCALARVYLTYALCFMGYWFPLCTEELNQKI